VSLSGLKGASEIEECTRVVVGFILDDLHQLEEVVEQLIVGQGLQTFDRMVSHLKRDEYRIHRAQKTTGRGKSSTNLSVGELRVEKLQGLDGRWLSEEAQH
jgi:hypothetical protein